MLGPEPDNDVGITLETMLAQQYRNSVAAVLLVVNDVVPFLAVGLSIQPN